MAQASMYVTTATRPVVSLSLPLLPPLSLALSPALSPRALLDIHTLIYTVLI